MYIYIDISNLSLRKEEKRRVGERKKGNGKD